MAYALNIRSDNQTSTPIKTLWDECGVLEDPPSMVNLAYPPHITFAIYDEIDPVFANLEQTTTSYL